MNKVSNYISLLIFMLTGGFLSILIGMEKLPFDTITYHFYIAYAFLNDRLSTDFCVGGTNTCLNPIVEIPFYLAVKYFNNFPKTVAFVFGTGYGIYLFVLYNLLRLLVKNKSKKITLTFIVFAMLIAATGHIASINIATTYHDMTATTILFIAICLIFRHKNNRWTQVLAGALTGVAVGIKLQCGIFFAALILTMLFCKKDFQKPYKSIISYVAGFFAGLGLYSGFWFYKVYKTFGNPLFPYWNNIFHSKYAEDLVLKKDLFQYPQNALQTALYPYWLIFNQKDGLRDLRLSTVYTLFFACLGLFALAKAKTARALSILNRYFYWNRCKFLIIFGAFSYLFWMILCPYSRYIMPIETLSGMLICLFTFLILLTARKPLLWVLTLFVITITLVGTTKTSFEHRVPFNNKVLYFDDAKIPDGATVLLSHVNHCSPSAVIPFQNPKARYIFYPSLNNDLTPITDISKIIERGELYIITDIPNYYTKNEAISKSIQADLKDKVTPVDCKALKSNIDIEIVVCKLKATGINE